jgi:hypothetical protein
LPWRQSGNAVGVSEETPQRDRLFDEVADRYDPATRRAVRRAVFRGDPPVDPILAPLARAYVLRAAPTPAKSFPRWLAWLWGSLATLQLVMALTAWAGGHDVRGALQAGGAVLTLSVALFIPYVSRTSQERLERSRRILDQRDDGG